MPETDRNSPILKEIRENYTCFEEVWRPIREEGNKDMRYVAGNPWDEKDRSFREKYDRPVMTWDELSPYINQLVNDPRQNKRAIQINPRGNGATNVTAMLREDKIREIQYNSRAQSAFTTAFQGAAEEASATLGSMRGWLRTASRKTSTGRWLKSCPRSFSSRNCISIASRIRTAFCSIHPSRSRTLPTPLNVSSRSGCSAANPSAAGLGHAIPTGRAATPRKHQDGSRKRLCAWRRTTRRSSSAGSCIYSTVRIIPRIAWLCMATICWE